MRNGTQLLVMIACALAAPPVNATDFREIQVWVGSGWAPSTGFAALADGTLAVVKLKGSTELHHEVCARTTREEVEMLARLVGQIPATAPWGEHRILSNNCFDEPREMLLVTTGSGELDVSVSLMCRPANVPSWITKLTDAMHGLQQKYEACRIQTN